MKCPDCGFENRPNLKFCEECGQSLAKSAKMPATTTCPTCGYENRPGIKFCEECGHALGVPVSPPAALRCPACGHDNRAGIRFCEECGTDLTKPRKKVLPVGGFGRLAAFVRQNPWRTATLALLGVLAVVLLNTGLERLRYAVTKNEARDMADAAVQVYYPGITDLTPRVEEHQDEDGDTLLSYAYFEEVSIQDENGVTMQFTQGAIAVVNRDTGEVQVISIR